MTESTNLAAVLQTFADTRHREKLGPPLPPLPNNIGDAVAAVHCLIGGDPVEVATGFKALAQRNRELVDDPDAIAAALAAQVQLLERLFLRYIQRAEACTKPEHRHLAMRTALACQRQSIAAMSAIYQVQRDKACN